ncbi:ABC transporter substrate-binding protein [Paenibacillus filicis]|uniref:ABC transporter substrate-binding protein n=1 Tax=Paenibacillus gyeongsangnamensis TaxID=3388067 RepID=A0ABT4QF33_9BACL|nr:ABC transporter substrate-binding protein [Paenibacillus filicis]MCZ8515494.1 ABC transporter substrate-binding protein [Paenibacillus filicis]
MKRLPAILLASMISSIVALSGCSTKEETSAVHPSGSQDIANEAQTKSNKKITIRFYSYNLGNAVFGAGTQKLIDEFQASHPNISVEGVPVPITDLMTRVQADIAAGSPPDVAQLGFGAMDLYVNGFGAVPLESIVSPEEWKKNFEGFSPNGLALGKYNGKTYGLAFTFSTPVLFYNASLFKEAGLDPEKPPTTWEQTKQQALQIVSKTKAQGIHVSGSTPTSGDWLVQSIIGSNGGSVLSDDRKKLNFDAPETIGALQMWRDLVDSGASDKLNDNEAMEEMSQGKLGMFLQSSAIQGSLLKGATSNNWELRAAEMPGFGTKPTTPTNSGSALFILSKDAEKQKAAWEFLKFVTSERGYTIITSEIGYLPLRTSILDDPKYLKDWAKDHPLIQPNIRQLERLRPAAAFPGVNFSQISTILINAVQKAVLSKSDVTKVMQDAQNQAQKLMP